MATIDQPAGDLERFFGQLPLTRKIAKKINGLTIALLSD
jgi:hypothetical protein